MDPGQRWALSAARRALMDAGWPNWSVDSDKVAVILGNAIGGEKHYQSSMRIQLPEALKRVAESATLQTLPADMQHKIVEEARALYLDNMFEITEDTMPGELSNVIAGRIANVLNLAAPTTRPTPRARPAWPPSTRRSSASTTTSTTRSSPVASTATWVSTRS
jgi:acyl transferase domain-containing protein